MWVVSVLNCFVPGTFLSKGVTTYAARYRARYRALLRHRFGMWACITAHFGYDLILMLQAIN